MTKKWTIFYGIYLNFLLDVVWILLKLVCLHSINQVEIHMLLMCFAVCFGGILYSRGEPFSIRFFCPFIILCYSASFKSSLDACMSEAFS